MFSAKNYGLPKDLIEAAKKVHEKQLEEGTGFDNPEFRAHVRRQIMTAAREEEKKGTPTKGTGFDNPEFRAHVRRQIMTAARAKEKEGTPTTGFDNPEFRAHVMRQIMAAAREEEKKRVAKEAVELEEVQFTEEELAEAFAAFLEENFHVDMLTEEDLDYVFENEFPQWLEENIVNLGRAVFNAAKKGVKFYRNFYRNNPGRALFSGGVGVGTVAADNVLRNRSSDKQKQDIPPLPVRKPKKKEMNKTLPGAKKPQTEEVQFTEEELAEAFAIFLEENFHVEMLTEEDLDYVFENEFPQWLEESVAGRIEERKRQQKRAEAAAAEAAKEAEAKRNYRSRKDEVLRAKAASAASASTAAGSFRAAQTVPSGTGPAAGSFRAAQTVPSGTGPAAGSFRAAQTVSSTPAPSTSPTARNQVSAKPSISSRKQTGGPSLFQQAKQAVRPTPGDSGRTATDRLKYMAARGNRASQQALRGPKKDWRSSVFNPDGN